MDRPIVSTGLKVARLSDSDVPSLLLQRVGRFQPTEAIKVSYLHMWLQADEFRTYLADQATGTQLPHISATDIESVLLPLPPINEQSEVVKTVELKLSVIRRVEEIIRDASSRYGTLESTILAKAFRGELVPQDLNDEPASVLLDRLRAERASAPSGRSKAKARSSKRSRQE